MIPVAIGGLIGLYLLFHGCILLQRRPRSSRDKIPVLTPTPSPGTMLSTFKEPQQSTASEIIQLSPDGAPRNTDTQQGKIAAALLRAGAFSPASWTAAEDSPTATLHLTDEQTTRAARPGDVVESLELNVSKVLKKAASNDPHPLTHGAGNQPFRWKPALMVWFGPILTITCLYILALHFGWM